jgi:sigma-B regulation protein RsbQ
MITDTPVLVLLPGMDGTGDLFVPLLEALGGQFETIVVRYPLYEPLDYAELLPIARASLPAHRPFVLVAESFSGPIGIALAAEAASGLRGLVLCGSFARTPRPSLSALARWLHLLPLNAAMMRIGLAAMLGRPVAASLRALVERTVARVPPHVLRARLRAVVRSDATRALATVDAPILYIQATCDHAVPPSAASFIRQIKPETDVVRIDGPHFLLQVRPEAAAGEIARFAKAVSTNHEAGSFIPPTTPRKV